MGQQWDGGDVAFRPETWAALAEHLHPGAFGMAFSGARTWHRMAVAIEDAGLIIHPVIYAWVYGSGFPKATRANIPFQQAALFAFWLNAALCCLMVLAKALLDGYVYGAQALKPAAEPIIVFQKPYESRPVDDITATGAGALNVDGARIRAKEELARERGKNPSDEKTRGAWQTVNRKGGKGSGFKRIRANKEPSGRWPANLMLSHHPECVPVGVAADEYAINRFKEGAKPFGGGAGKEYDSEAAEVERTVWECHADCQVRKLDERSGTLKSGDMPEGARYSGWGKHNIYGKGRPHEQVAYGDSGGASRFF